MTLLRVLLSLSAVLALANGVCFDNGDKEIGGKCFKFVAKQLSFEDARNYCHYTSSNPAYLAYVPDQFTANFLASYARSLFNTNDGFFWIGLSRTKSYNPWTWDTGFQLAWSNFNGNQLSDNFVAESIVNGKWNTFGDDTKLYFVCSYDPTAPPTFAPPASTTPGTTTSTTTTTSVPTTTDYYRNCSPITSNYTFFFGYSTYLELEDFQLTKDTIIKKLRENPLNYKVFADVRLDTQNGATIFYHYDLKSFEQSINSHLPDESLGYTDPEEDTDVFSVLSTYFHYNDVCGTRVILLLNRLAGESKEGDVLDYEFLNNRDVKIFVIEPENYNGGFIYPTHSLALKTCGMITYTNGTVYQNESGTKKAAELYMSAPYFDQLIGCKDLDTIGNGTYSLGTLNLEQFQQPTINTTLAIVLETEYLHFGPFNVTIIQSNVNGWNRSVSYTNDDLVPGVNMIFKQMELQTGTQSQLTFVSLLDDYRSVSFRLYTNAN